ncbi:hypothetical protein BDD12DRAFT_832768 [Trichophaea hybrida]|nr:hypothetical protein BDD12DRAFT_832768 [Trichophaea hybrida]
MLLGPSEFPLVVFLLHLAQFPLFEHPNKYCCSFYRESDWLRIIYRVSGIGVRISAILWINYSRLPHTWNRPSASVTRSRLSIPHG